MLHPSAQELIKNNQSRYSLVMATAKIARKLSYEAEQNKERLDQKPVKMAVEMLKNGDMDFVESKNDDMTELNVRQYPVMADAYGDKAEEE